MIQIDNFMDKKKKGHIKNPTRSSLFHIDRKLTVFFGLMVLTLMTILAVSGFFFYSKIADNNRKELEKTIVGLLADSINRISFSGKYHARLLVNQIEESQKRIDSISVLDSRMNIIAESKNYNLVNHNIPVSIINKVIQSKETHIRDNMSNGKHFRQIIMPYKSGYMESDSGVIIVVLQDFFNHDQKRSNHFCMLFIVIILTLICLCITYFISKKVSGPVIELAKEYEILLKHAPILIRISDRDGQRIEKSALLKEFEKNSDYDILKKDVVQVFEKNGFLEKELTLLVDSIEKVFWVTSFPVMKNRAGDAIIACAIGLDITDLKNIETELRDKEENLRVTLDSIGDGVITTDNKYKITSINPVALKLTGWSLDEALGKDLARVYNIFFEGKKSEEENFKRILFNEGSRISEPVTLISRDKEHFTIRDSGSIIKNSKDEAIGIVIVFCDITQERALQSKLHHKNKMDAIGQLAGGVAHDFNNLLGGIISSAELIEIAVEDSGADVNKYIDVIIQSSTRAADLISKLLAFGRKGRIISKNIDIHAIINETASLLCCTIDKKIEVKLNLEAKKSIVFADSSGLQNAFLNLGINASNAMPAGGQFIFETKSIELDEDYCKTSSFEISPGQYIKIGFRDTGSGIPKENISKIFEPFFTTKKAGKGTGLGLAAVYGTVLDHNGAIEVYSETGVGTVFYIYLKCVNEIPQELNINEKIVLHKGSGLILLVDDEEFIRLIGSSLLKKMGYSVILAENGFQAVEIFKERHEEIDLVVVDMVMPEMNGEETFYKLKELDKDIKIVISSGFSKQQSISRLMKDGLSGFISKPFRIADFSRLIKSLLG